MFPKGLTEPIPAAYPSDQMAKKPQPAELQPLLTITGLKVTIGRPLSHEPRDSFDWKENGPLKVGVPTPLGASYPYGVRFFVPPAMLVEYDNPSEYELVVTLEAAMSENGPECVRLTATPRPGGPPVSLRRIKIIKVDAIVRAALDLVAVEISWTASDQPGVKIGQAAPVTDWTAFDGATSTRTRESEELLREVATVYVRGKSTGKPHVEVMRHFGWKDEKAKSWERKARPYITELEKEKSNG